MALPRTVTRLVQQVGKVTVNRLVLAALARGVRLPGVRPDTVIALATVGRRSGRRRVTPMGYLRVDEDRLWVVSEHGESSDWYRNARAAGTVRVLFDGRWREATVRPLPEEKPAAVLRRFRSKLVAAANRALWYRPAVVELHLDGR